MTREYRCEYCGQVVEITPEQAKLYNDGTDEHGRRLDCMVREGPHLMLPEL